MYIYRDICIYIHIYVCIYIYIFLSMPTYIHTYIHTYRYIQIHMYVYTYIQIHMYVYIYIHFKKSYQGALHYLRHIPELRDILNSPGARSEGVSPPNQAGLFGLEGHPTDPYLEYGMTSSFDPSWK